MENNSLPFHSGPVDVLRYGFQSLEHDSTSAHPIIAIEKNVRPPFPVFIIFS